MSIPPVLMTQAACRCLSLWNGTTNNSPPAGWDAPSFDDSAWALSANPTPAVPELPTDHKFVNGTTTTGTLLAGDPLQSGAERVWSSAAPANVAEEILIRWRFNLPTAGPFTNWEVWVEDADGTFGGLSSGLVTINSNLSILLNAVNWNGAHAYLLPNAQNVFAIWVNNANTSTLPTWSPAAWISMKLVFPDAVASGRGHGWTAVIG